MDSYLPPTIGFVLGFLIGFPKSRKWLLSELNKLKINYKKNQEKKKNPPIPP